MEKYYQISISKLVDTFSRIESGKALDFTVNTSEGYSSSSLIAKEDIIIASINDKVYYNFTVVEKTSDELKLKKTFEIQKSINHSIDEVGVFEEISKNEYNSICSSLFNQYNTETSSREDNTVTQKPEPKTSPQFPFNISEFQKSCKEAGLKYSNLFITRFVSSLITKPFVILTGLAGSGKTKLAQAFVQWISASEEQYKIIPVGADWTNREPLLGYLNALNIEEYVKPESGVLDLIIKANNEPNLPFFLILDEMNLSHVERYFADFLSVMESNEAIPLFAGDDEKSSVPAKLYLPKNLFIIGTVNIDETTNMFSPKVLDRANTIEFRVAQNEMEEFLNTIGEVNLKSICQKGAGMAEHFVTLTENKNLAMDKAEINEVLLQFFDELKKTGAEFGYRSATEILRLCNQLSNIKTDISTDEKIDIAMMQKLLPKLHGSRRKLCPILETLGGFCISGTTSIVKDVFENDDFDFNGTNVRFPLTLEKIARMYKGAIDNGFTSFAEA